MLISLVVRIILQCIDTSKYNIVHYKCIEFCQFYFSKYRKINLKKKTKIKKQEGKKEEWPQSKYDKSF